MLKINEEELGITRNKIAEGQSIDNDGWVVNCPDCDKEFHYTGFFDNSDTTKCKCGCVFRTSKIWVDDSKYIE